MGRGLVENNEYLGQSIDSIVSVEEGEEISSRPVHSDDVEEEIPDLNDNYDEIEATGLDGRKKKMKIN